MLTNIYDILCFLTSNGIRFDNTEEYLAFYKELQHG